MNDFMELRRVMDVALKRWWFIVLMAAICAGLSYGVTKRQTPVYEARTTVLVGQSIELAQLERVDIQTSEALVQTYVEMAQREPVLDGVVKSLGLEGTWLNLRKHITVQPVVGTQLIEIIVESDTPESARQVADEVANQLLLVSPKSVTENPVSDPIQAFNREQVVSLQERILAGQQRLDELERAIAGAGSELELAALQNEKRTLEGLIVDWERNYTELLPFTSVAPDKEPNRLTVIERAYSNNSQIRPNVRLNTLLGGILGLVAALGIIFLLEFLDETYKTADDLSQSDGLEILGSVGKIRGKKYSDKVITRLAPFSPLAESYRIIRNRLHLDADVISKRCIMITSAVPQEGKTLTVANLGIILAEANIKTIIVDADLRGSALHQAFDLKSEYGLADVLRQPGARVEEYLKATPVANLQVLTSGKVPSNATELLGSGSRGILKIINDLKQLADIVILDSPSAAVFSDAMSLSNQVDDVILVVRAGKSKRSDLKKTLINLQNNRADFLGCIFNFSPAEPTFLSRPADYFKPKWAAPSSASKTPVTAKSVEVVKKNDFDYLMSDTDKSSQAVVLEKAVTGFAAEGRQVQVAILNEAQDSGVGTISEAQAEDASGSGDQMPAESAATVDENAELVIAELESAEKEMRSRQRNPKNFKKSADHPNISQNGSGEEASDD